MATGNLLLGQASGAVGSLVFARANGQQVTKARQEQVRYSNTLAQAIQRICISTAGQAYRHMQEVCCRSFQGIPTGKATHDEFMKRNVRLLRQSIRQADAQNLTYSDLRYFTPVGNDTLQPNAYIVSSGSLPSIIFGISPNDPTHARMAGGGISYRQVIAFYGLKRGDILTFVFMQPDSSGIVRARSASVVLDPWSPIGGKASLDVPFVSVDNKINCPHPDNSGEFTYLINDSGDIIYSLVNSDVPLIAAGVFASRRSAAGPWMHSDCQLSLYSGSDVLDKFTLQKAIEVANGAPIDAISPDYLNNAGTTKLPFSDLKFLDHLEFAGSQYILTNISSIVNLEFIIEAQLTSITRLFATLVGALGPAYRDYKIILGESSDGVFYCQTGPGMYDYIYASSLDLQKHTFVIDIKESIVKFSIDEYVYQKNYQSTQSVLYNIAIGGRYTNNGIKNFSKFKLYSFKVKRNNIIIYDFRPAIKQEELGLYESIESQFYPINDAAALNEHSI